MQKNENNTVTFPTKTHTTLTKRIGSTTFTINVHFSETSTETLEDKVVRLIDMEVDKTA
jgi:hypothetical protein